VFEKEYQLHMEFGWAMYAFWGTILLVGILNHACSHFWSVREPSLVDAEQGRKPSDRAASRSIGNVLPQWLHKYLVLPPLFGSRRQERLWTFAVPTRLETIIIFSYWLLNLVLCCVTYEIFWPNL
jgi:hypothetical protein